MVDGKVVIISLDGKDFVILLTLKRFVACFSLHKSFDWQKCEELKMKKKNTESFLLTHRKDR